MEPEEKKELKLNSPVAAGEPLVFSWPLVETSKYSGSLEILDTIKLVMNDFEQFKPVMERQGGPKIDSIQTKNYDDMKLLCDKYNKAAATISGLWKGATMPGNKRWSSERADPALLKQIHVRAYNRAVSDPSRLNKHYESFSSQTYGETSFDRMQKILDDLKPKERDVFVDLGSGVGNLVMHVAGGSRVKRAVGIEIAELPVQYSEQMKFEFTRWMKWYGKKLRSYDLFRGDFMDEKYRDLITKDATIIFINNFAFKPDLEDKIKRYLLSELKPGTRIVTTKPYATPNANRSITDRQMSDISAMMDVVELPPMQNAASWTGNYVAYYLHTITHAKIANFFANQKLLPALKSSGDSSRRSSSSSSSKTRSSSVANRGSSRESSVASPAAVHPMAHPAATTAYHHASPPASHVASQYDEEHAFGPTTRRKWNDYVTQLERNKKEKKKVIDVVGRSSSEARSAMPKPMISPSSSGGVKGIRWGDGDSFDVETVAAEPLKHHRHAPLSPKRGRPRKVPLPVHRRSSGGTVGNEETKRHIDILHRLTLDAQKRDRTTTNGEADDGLHVTDLPTVNAIGASSKYPNLDAYLNKLREDYEAHLDLMQTDAYRDAILNDIQKEETRRIQLEKRVEVLERQVAGLQHDGVLILRQRLGELNMEAETPSALLAQSKEIVAHHKQIQAHCAALERQNAALDADNTQLAAAIAERDNALLSSGALAAFGISSDLNCDAAKQLIIDNLMQHYRKKRALLADTSALQSEICALENTPPTSIAGSTIAIGTTLSRDEEIRRRQSKPSTTGDHRLNNESTAIAVEINSNELTRPYRIPRKKTNGPETVEKRVTAIAAATTGDETTRSPLLFSSQQQPTTSGYGRRIVPTTRKEPLATEVSWKGMDLLDNIFQSMDKNAKKIEGKTSNKRKIAQQKDNQVKRATSDSCAHQPSSSSSLPPEYLLLTVEHLQRHETTAACYSFANKGLMETLLEQKMLTGRLDACTELGFRPGTPPAMGIGGQSNSRMETFDERPGVSRIPPRLDDNRRGPRTPPDHRIAVAVGPRTPIERSSSFDSADRRGPRTPPDGSSARSAVGSEYSDTPPPPPPLPLPATVQLAPLPLPAMVQLPPQKSRRDLIAEMAELTKLPTRQLEQCLGEDLQQALTHVDHSVLLDTLRKVFSTIGQQMPPIAEVSSSMSPTGGNVEETESKRGYVAVADAMDLESENSSPDNCTPNMLSGDRPLLMAPPRPPVLSLPVAPPVHPLIAAAAAPLPLLGTIPPFDYRSTSLLASSSTSPPIPPFDYRSTSLLASASTSPPTSSGFQQNRGPSKTIGESFDYRSASLLASASTSPPIPPFDYRSASLLASSSTSPPSSGFQQNRGPSKTIGESRMRIDLTRPLENVNQPATTTEISQSRGATRGINRPIKTQFNRSQPMKINQQRSMAKRGTTRLRANAKRLQNLSTLSSDANRVPPFVQRYPAPPPNMSSQPPRSMVHQQQQQTAMDPNMSSRPPRSMVHQQQQQHQQQTAMEPTMSSQPPRSMVHQQHQQQQHQQQTAMEPNGPSISTTTTPPNTQSRMIQTLMSALAIPNHRQSTAPPPPRPMVHHQQQHQQQQQTAMEPTMSSQPPRPMVHQPLPTHNPAPAGGLVCPIRAPEPVFLDRYGMPLPVPGREHALPSPGLVNSMNYPHCAAPPPLPLPPLPPPLPPMMMMMPPRFLPPPPPIPEAMSRPPPCSFDMPPQGLFNGPPSQGGQMIRGGPPPRMSPFARMPPPPFIQPGGIIYRPRF